MSNRKSIVNSNSSGFTLVEFVIAMGLMIIVGFGASWTLGLVSQNQNSVLEANEELDYSREAHLVFKKTTEYRKPNGVVTQANVCKALLESKIENDPVAVNWFRNYDPNSNSNPPLNLDISDVNIVGYQPETGQTNNSNVFTGTNGKIQIRYGQKVISNQLLTNFVMLDKFQGKLSNDRGMVRVDAALQTRTYTYFRADFNYTISAGKSSGRNAKAFSIYLLILPLSNKISLVDCSTEVDTTMAAMERFCNSLGKDFVLGIGDPLATVNPSAADDAEQRLRCLAPIYDSSMQAKNPDTSIRVTHYIPLQEVFCDFASRGYSTLGRFCVGEAIK